MAVAPKIRQPTLNVPANGNGKLRVLVVDDEVAFGNVMREVLVSFGLDVRLAYRAEEALTLMRQQTPDLLMIDVMMPEGTGQAAWVRFSAAHCSVFGPGPRP